MSIISRLLNFKNLPVAETTLLSVSRLVVSGINFPSIEVKSTKNEKELKRMFEEFVNAKNAKNLYINIRFKLLKLLNCLGFEILLNGQSIMISFSFEKEIDRKAIFGLFLANQICVTEVELGNEYRMNLSVETFMPQFRDLWLNELQPIIIRESCKESLKAKGYNYNNQQIEKILKENPLIYKGYIEDMEKMWLDEM